MCRTSVDIVKLPYPGTVPAVPALKQRVQRDTSNRPILSRLPDPFSYTQAHRGKFAENHSWPSPFLTGIFNKRPDVLGAPDGRARADFTGLG